MVLFLNAAGCQPWVDLSGTGNNITMVNGPELQAGFPCSYYFSGNNQYLYTSTPSVYSPIFSLGVWFKTTVASGSSLVGLENMQFGNTSSIVNPLLYVGLDGKLYFALFSPSSFLTLATPFLVTDGILRYAIATSTGTVMTLYVDGLAVANRTINSTAFTFSAIWDVLVAPTQPGKSWDDMRQVCVSKQQRLCSASEMCPNGQPITVLNSFSVDNWIAVNDEYNQWVTYFNFSHSLCKTHSQLANSLPTWGIGTGVAVFARAAMCCGAPKFTGHWRIGSYAAAIGGYPFSVNGYFSGNVALTQVFSSVLSADQVYQTNSAIISNGTLIPNALSCPRGKFLPIVFFLNS
jgi:hypothetical protein